LRLRDIGAYLQKVLDGQLPVNHAILGNLQDVFNLLPNLSSPEVDGTSGGGELAYAMSVKTNDQLMAIYLSSLIRAITAFHDLIENKIQNRQQQEEKEAKRDEGTGTKDEKRENGAGGPSVDQKEVGDKEKDVKDKQK
jgi:26S proteasome regulatory subunit N8